MVSTLGIILYGNFVLLTFVYLYLFHIRRLIGFQLGMNISIIAGGFVSIITGVILIYQFPLHFVPVTMASTIIGFVVGGMFGALFDYQTFLTGYGNGLMMGIMAPMVGASANSSTSFIIFIETVFILSLIVILSSAKSS
ncbi:hypothetical protein [Salirhabdus salicampi]|uniref:hypothetical protein n=1 Tax=Salirhabdus salicampi TaxID=476102 RepID=UPI0020C1E452|nr:hypothetical protein [Salirhabdus salicampi]MCP8616001.1 hypothetical protein [Salirhabdus salicampi]